SPLISSSTHVLPISTLFPYTTLFRSYGFPEILGVVNATLLAALAEPNRLRIVGLLGAAPRSVGEMAAALRLRQPQVTKHLQTLRSEEHTSELQSRGHLVCRLLLEKKN